VIVALSLTCARLYRRFVLGLGPSSGSNIYAAVGTVAGAGVADRIFLQNATTPNFVTVLLGRSDGIQAQ
jgi:hypothetical protein